MEWVQARINDLHGPGRLSYAEIARRAGVSKQYFGQVKAGDVPPSQKLIDGMCKAFGLQPPAPPSGKRIVDAVKSPTEGVKATAREEELMAMIERLLASHEALLLSDQRKDAQLQLQSNMINLLSAAVEGQTARLKAVEASLESLPARLRVAR